MPKAACCKPVFFPDRAEIQQDSSTADNPSQTWTGKAFKESLPCKVTDTSGDETFRGRQIEAHISHVVECRYFSGVTPSMRLYLTGGIYNGRTLNIEYVKIVREAGKIPLQWLYCKELAE